MFAVNTQERPPMMVPGLVLSELGGENHVLFVSYPFSG